MNKVASSCIEKKGKYKVARASFQITEVKENSLPKVSAFSLYILLFYYKLTLVKDNIAFVYEPNKN